MSSINAPLVVGYKTVDAPAVAGSPYASGSPASPIPPVSVSAPGEEFAADGPSDELKLFKKIVAIEIGFADIAAVANKLLGPIFPDNSRVVRSYYEVTTTFTSATDAATIGIGFATDDSAGIVGTLAISAVGNIWDAGLHEGIQDGAAANFGEKLTAARQLQIIRGGAEVLTAGNLVLFVEFVTSV